MYIFGGWDGNKRLNDLYSLEMTLYAWSEIKVLSSAPSPRAGMGMVAVNDKLYLFGGSGPSTTCFGDF